MENGEKMKLLFVYGSTRPNSVGKKVLHRMVESARSAGHTVLEYDLTQPLRSCRGCGACRTSQSNCVQQDELTGYLNELFTANQVVVCVPMYMGQAAGQCITFMNRHYCLKDKAKRNRLPSGIRVNVIFTQGAPQDYAAYQSAQQWYFNSLVRYGLEPGECRVVGGDSDLSESGELLQWARAWGQSL